MMYIRDSLKFLKSAGTAGKNVISLSPPNCLFSQVFKHFVALFYLVPFYDIHEFGVVYLFTQSSKWDFFSSLTRYYILTLNYQKNFLKETPSSITVPVLFYFQIKRCILQALILIFNFDSSLVRWFWL
jgi:hypothetical protein